MRASHRSRPVRDRLARLDDAVVPAAAERVAGALAATAAARARAGAALRGDEVRTPGEPAGGAQPAVLARLDARLARRGPLAVLGALPGAGAALAAAVALGGGLALLALDEPAPDRLVTAAAPDAPPAGPGDGGSTAPGGGAESPGAEPGADPDELPGVGSTGPAQPDTLLGPDDPLDAGAHLTRVAADLALLALTAPDTPVPSLVHLAEHVTPQRAAELAAGVPVQQVVVRVPLGVEQTAVTTVPAQRLPDDAVVAFRTLAAQLRAGVVADETAAAGSPPGDAAGDVLRVSADLGRRQAEVLETGPDCACLVALLVTGTPGELAPLAARPGVLAVEPGPAGVPPEQLTLRPVLPAGAPGGPS